MRYALLLLAAVTATPASALSLVYNDFSNTGGLSLNGSAATAIDASNRKVLRVTPSAYGQSGSVFSTTPITLGSDVSFSTRFTFNINAPLNGGADGLVFVVQTNSANVGGAGGGIGYQGIPKSVGIEFDTWYNGAVGDIDDNHVGINLNGSVNSVLATTSPFLLDDDGDLTAWVDYNGATQLLEVRLTSGGGLRPTAALLSYNVDLVSVLGTPDAFVGFTSGTGAAADNHDVVNWVFEDSYKPILGVPEPATWALLIAGFGCVGAAARRRRPLTA